MVMGLVIIVFKSFDFDQDILDLGDGLAVCVVATVVVLGEHLDCGLVRCILGLCWAVKTWGSDKLGRISTLLVFVSPTRKPV